MSDDGLVIGGGGTVAVATDDQLARVERLESFVATARTILTQLVGIDDALSEGELTVAAAPASAFVAKRELRSAIPSLAHAADLAAVTAKVTRVAMLAYGAAEYGIEKTIDDWVGAFARVIGRLSGPALFLTDAELVVMMGLISPKVSSGGDSGSGKDDPIWQKFLADHPVLLNNPLLAKWIKLIVDGMDDSMLAAFGLPPSAIQALKVSGKTGPALAAAVLVALGLPFGKMTESPVRIAAKTTTVTPGSAPSGWKDRIDRIPDTAHNGGYQIRIDKFVDASGKRSFEVYLSGTQTFSTSRTDTPFDFTSDTNGLAGLPNGALAAVEKAMTDAGIKPGDPVNITGHSEGGLIAHEVAASGHWNVQVALEAGAPVSHSPVPGHTTEVALQHSEDIVPSLGGMRDIRDKAIVVDTTAFPDGNIPTGDASPPAHDTHRYAHTAKELDHAASSLVTEAKEKANASEKGATTTVTTTLYRTERVHRD